jgi:hypothetical protein
MTEMVEVNGYLTQPHLAINTRLWFLEREDKRGEEAAHIVKNILHYKAKIKEETGLDFSDFDACYKKLDNFIYISFKDDNRNVFCQKFNINESFTIDVLIENLKNNKGNGSNYD